MKIIRGRSTNPAQPATSPFPLANGIFLELRGGDFCMPHGDGDWFDAEHPLTKAWRRAFAHAWLPFLSWRWGKRGGYIGAKCYGVDSPTYAAFAGADQVYAGSQALMLSCRPFATLEPSQ